MQQVPLPLSEGQCSGPLFGPLAIKKPSKSKLRAKIYRLKVKRATPKWADLDAIKALYKEAKAKTKATGVVWSVDHVIPLKGEFVCGLHVDYNLEIKLRDDNLKKGNKFEDQPSLFDGQGHIPLQQVQD